MMTFSAITVGPYVMNVEATERGISKLSISDYPYQKAKNLNNIIDQFEKHAKKFLHGDAHAFDDLPLDTAGTPFQCKVWNATRKIPYGQTRTYAQIAKQIGHPKAVRAVGTALGKNPVCIVVPCHRVVPQSGGIGNYAYGTAMKRWLLEHERKNAMKA